jgi:hypothetical protein
MRPTVLLCLIALVAGTHTLHAQRPSPADAPTTAIRPGIGAGLGVAFL